MQYQDMTKKEMQREYHRLCQRYQEYEQQGLQLDLSAESLRRSSWHFRSACWVN